MQKPPLTVLFISHSGDLGGAERSLLDLLNNLDNKKFNPLVIIPYKGELASALEKQGTLYFIRFIDRWIPSVSEYGIQHLLSFFKGLKGRLWSIAALVEKHHVDIIYTNTITTIDGALIAKKYKIPHIWHAREYSAGNSDIKSYIPFPHLIINALSCHIICNSKSLKQKLSSWLLSTPKSTIYNGVKVGRNTACYDSATLYDALNITADTKLITTVCAISPRKDLETFITAAAKVVEHLKDVRFLILGEGDAVYVQHLKDLVKEYGLSNYVCFLGQRHDALEIMEISSIVTLTSNQEAFGRVIIESMSVSTPVISTKSGGPSEIITDGVDGFLIAIGDTVALSEKIIRLLKSPELAHELSANGLKKVVDLYSIDNYISSIESLILSTFAKSIAHG